MLWYLVSLMAVLVVGMTSHVSQAPFHKRTAEHRPPQRHNANHRPLQRHNNDNRHPLLHKRIINGTIITDLQCPYYAMLYYGGVHAGGVILGRQVILTAASVVDGFSDTEIEIFVGVSTIAYTYIRFVYDNRKTIKHPQYQPNSSDYDLALMFLDIPMGLGYGIATIPLAKEQAPIGSRVSMCGFGYWKCENASSSDTCQGEASYYLRWGDFEVQGYEGNTMYATGDGVSSCFGDFGGPVAQDEQLQGVASKIQYQNCTGNNFIVSIPPHTAWIMETIRQQNVTI